MRLLYFLILFFFISGCSTVEVTKEVIKATSSIKTSVEQILPNKDKDESKIEERNQSLEEKIVLDKEKKIIEKEKEKEKSIIKSQQRLADINFIGKTEVQLISSIGNPQLKRTDGSVLMLRYDTDGCRLFLFFNEKIKNKKVEYFEIRNSFGELLNSKQSIEQCYREFKLIK